MFFKVLPRSRNCFGNKTFSSRNFFHHGKFPGLKALLSDLLVHFTSSVFLEFGYKFHCFHCKHSSGVAKWSLSFGKLCFAWLKDRKITLWSD